MACRWRTLAWVMLDADLGVSSSFARKVAKAVHSSKVLLSPKP